MSRQVANLRLGKIQSLIRRRGPTAEEFCNSGYQMRYTKISPRTFHGFCLEKIYYSNSW